jgi:outer membrane receptor for ferrienterochelin and colicins
MDVGFFYNTMDNLITLAISPNDPQQYTYVNIGEYSTIGNTINTGIRYKQINLNLGMANVGRLNTLSALYADVPKYNFSPELRINSTYRNKEHGFSVAAFYKYNGQRNGFFLSDDNVSQSLINDYHLLDMNITKQLLDGKLEWTLGVKNLLDVQDITSTNGSGGVHSGNSGTIPMNWGRSFFCALKFKI